MNRRDFGRAGIAATLGASVSASAQAAGPSWFYELRTYELRYDMDTGKIDAAFAEKELPVLKEGASGPIGCFNVVSGQNSPALMVLIPYSDLSRIQSNTQIAVKGNSIKDSWTSFESLEGLPYVRYKSTLLRAFDGHPKPELPPKREDGHLFELRTYESKNSVKSAAKIDMFNQEEIQIFRDCGMFPVFFGEGVFGDRLPLLTYMLAYEDRAARDKVWATFASNPDWNRIKGDPRWADTVSVIHASFLSPKSYSEIR